MAGRGGGIPAGEAGGATASGMPRMPAPRHGLAGAVVGNRLHLVSGDVQSAGIADMPLHSSSHDAFELAGQ